MNRASGAEVCALANRELATRANTMNITLRTRI